MRIDSVKKCKSVPRMIGKEQLKKNCNQRIGRVGSSMDEGELNDSQQSKNFKWSEARINSSV